MAESFDVSARLADGQSNVSDVQNYVSACQALGYQHPDLTAHAAQVRDWYASEEGMDLRALDTDCETLHSVSAEIQVALDRQEAERVVLAGAWDGAGAQASRDFLARHGAACAAAAAAVRNAAHTLTELRDHLWRAVDGKVATVLAIDDSSQARRADWLAAAQTVTTGAGDRAAASELVDQEVKPFVESVIREQWLAAMRATVDAIEAAYSVANASLASQSDAVFEVPGELGPTLTPIADAGSQTGSGGVAAPSVSSVGPGAGAAPVAPMGWTPPAATAAPAPTPWPPPAPVSPPAPAAPPETGPPPAMASPSMPSLGGGGGLPDMGSGLSGFGQQLGDLFGGLLGSDDTEVDPAGIGEHDLEEELEDPEDADDQEDGDEDVEDDTKPEDEDGEADPDEPVDQPDEPVEPSDAAACAPEPTEPAVTPPPEVPVPTAPPTPPEAPPAPPEPLAAPQPPAETIEDPPPPEAPNTGTPCEIAADELPQVGE